ncbi:DNA repair protein complementing XP-C cells isoform X2 [Pseudophryne corroboree]|uniref:DNA repair protein complementing XP-C cells isoform X2 n=1 Tax=Pseudophryne corroboree TaxID=495146 RepID=UPI0030816D7C
MAKRRGSVDSKVGGKKPRKQPAKRNRGGESGGAARGDGKGEAPEYGKAQNKKSKDAAPAARTTRKAVRGADKAPAGDGVQKPPPKAKKAAAKLVKTEDTEKEIEDLLSLESIAIVPDATVKDGCSSEEDAEDSDEEWEDVEELNVPALEALQATTSDDPGLPTKPVEIEIETAEAARKRMRREKRKAEFAAYMRRIMNRFSKDLRDDTHKVHLLCLLASGFYHNDICNLPNLQAVALSVVPVKFVNIPAARVDVIYLTNLVKWFKTTFTLNPEMSLDERELLSATLERRFGAYGVRDEEEMIHVKHSPREKSFSKTTKKSRKSQKSPKGKSKIDPKQKAEKAVKKEEAVAEESDEEGKLADTAASRKVANKKSVKVESDEDTKRRARPKNQLRRKAASKVTYKEESESCSGSSDSEFTYSDSDSDKSFNRKVTKVSPLLKGNRRKSGEGTAKSPVAHGQPKSKSTPKNDKVQPKGRGKIISTDDEEEGILSPPSGSDQWVEVYLEKDERWVCVDCVRGTINRPPLCFKAATKPVTYVVGFDNSGSVKDVTQRYDPGWMTGTRKRRIDPEWWQETLRPYRSKDPKQEDKEDVEFEAKLLDQPLPTSITELKNHPLYALKRHLLKYEAIYPESAAILGYCRGEAVYSRSCVHSLHSRDTWLKEARVVRLGEMPYKMVKGQSNRARKARLADPEKDCNDLALFGLWQTEDYQPPVAVDGKVPRNEFGNVYLFRPTMLPIGCAHLQVPNLHRVARKLDIDCVSAITGFDFHCGFSHPVTDGYIVCEEYKDVLLAAWENEQVEIERKQKEKREKRALGNWKLLIKGLLIRERLKARYGKEGTETLSSALGEGGLSSDEDGPAMETPAQDAAVSWPQNRQEDQQGRKAKQKSRREKRGEEKHLFPFEKL